MDGVVAEVQIKVSAIGEREQIEGDRIVEDIASLAAEAGVTADDLRIIREKPFPVDGAWLILLTLASKMTYDVWITFILPRLKEKYRVTTQEPSPGK